MDSFQTGWLRIREGQAADFAPDDRVGEMGPEPSGGGYKRAFRVDVYVKGHGRRELRSNSKMLKGAMKPLYDAWEIGRAAHPGQQPVVAVNGAKLVKGRYSSNYTPLLTIARWAHPPPDPDQGETAPASPPEPSPPAASVSSSPTVAPAAAEAEHWDNELDDSIDDLPY